MRNICKITIDIIDEFDTTLIDCAKNGYFLYSEKREKEAKSSGGDRPKLRRWRSCCEQLCVRQLAHMFSLARASKGSLVNQQLRRWRSCCGRRKLTNRGSGGRCSSPYFAPELADRPH